MSLSKEEIAQIVIKKHGITATWEPQGGGSNELKGVFDYDYFGDTGDMGIQTRQAVFKIADADAPTIDVGDSLTIDGKGFVITELQPDGEAMTEAVLMRV
jgi:hypothetical protein